MGKDCGTWVPHLQFEWQSPNLNPLDAGKPDSISAAMNMNPGFNMVSSNETAPAFASSTLPHLQLGRHSYEPGGWSYCLPRFRQGFTPAGLNFNAEGKPPADHVKTFGDKIGPYGDSSSPQKQFLVIDQTGGQTTIVYSSRFGSPGECLASWHSKLHGANYLRGNEPSFRRDLNLNLNMTEPTLADKVDENPGTGIESEMHEDTEEINALLYSDSYGYSTQDDDDDDEVTSTGHSPSTMTTHDNCETVREENAEGVASSAGKTKKRKPSGAEAILKEIEGENLKENPWVCATLLRLYANLGKADEVERIWKVCESKPRVDECLAAVEAWGKLKKIEEAEAVFEMVSKKWKLTANNYSVLLKIYANNKMLAKGKDLIKQMADSGLRIGPLTWDALVKLYIQAGEVEKADSIMQKAIQQNKMQPMFTTYLAILEQYAKRGDVHNSEKIFHKMRQAGYTSRISQFQVLIQAYIHAKVPAYGIRERMKADNLFPNKTLANHLALVDAFRKNAVSDLLD